jgi:hypothetical protein
MINHMAHATIRYTIYNSILKHIQSITSGIQVPGSKLIWFGTNAAVKSYTVPMKLLILEDLVEYFDKIRK